MFPSLNRATLATPALFLAFASSLFGYSLNGYIWPDGTQVMMHLELTRTIPTFQDGSTSWDGSATDALATWNQYISRVQFVAASAAGASDGDGVNQVLFSKNVYGVPWESRVLAITTHYSSGSTFLETDVIFNDNLKWNSYRGPQQGSGTTATYDFHRVALHEFGHVLGLDHPDQHGQTVTAIMNSIVSDLDALAADDIAGAMSLYRSHITSSLNPSSVRSGDPFSYRITADNGPTSFTASALPPGFTLDAASGVISGRCPSSGTFAVDIGASGASGSASARLQIVVTPLPLTSTPSPLPILIGDSFSYQIRATNNPTSFSVTGLPAGLTLDANTGLITGTPTVSGSFLVTIIATSPSSEARGTVFISIQPPHITSTAPAAVDVGSNFSYQILSTHNPTSFSASGLPAGLQLDSTTGLITGTPTQAGNFQVTLTATTSFGNAVATIGFVVLGPRFTGPTTVFTAIGAEANLNLTVSQPASSFSATGLPADLFIDLQTGVIHGVPTLSGSYNVTLRAQTNFGVATGFLSLVVTSNPATEQPVASFTGVVASFVVDAPRHRLYASVATEIRVFDTDLLAQIATISVTVNNPNLALSADGSMLFASERIGNYYIDRIDLQTLTVLTPLQPGVPVSSLCDVDGKTLIAYDGYGHVVQLDAVTGAAQSPFRSTQGHGFLALSPDRHTLYVGDQRTVARFDISQGAPVLLQEVQEGSSGTSFALSHDGKTLCYVGASFGSAILGADNLFSLRGYLQPFYSGLPAAFSPDDRTILAFAGFNNLLVFDAATLKQTRSILLSFSASIGGAVIDSQNRYIFVSTSGGLKVYSTGQIPTPVRPRSLLNVSTRLRSQTGEDVLIGGFIVKGDEPKKVILRGIGPSLPVSGKLADPMLELHGPDGTIVASNDNWNSHRVEVLNSTIPPKDEHESAIVATLAPGPYTAILRGVANTSGVASVELYDLAPSSNSTIANISSRGRVETGDNVMIGGFIIGGDQPTKVIVRAVGPSLGKSGVSGALSDTTLDLFDNNGNNFASNDDWQSDQPDEIIASTVAPSDPREAAIVRTLQPGNYTAIVRGKNGTSGVASVEIYNLEPQ